MSIKRGRSLNIRVGNLKSSPISITKWQTVVREIGEAHSTDYSKDNKTFDRKGALL